MADTARIRQLLRRPGGLVAVACVSAAVTAGLVISLESVRALSRETERLGGQEVYLVLPAEARLGEYLLARGHRLTLPEYRAVRAADALPGLSGRCSLLQVRTNIGGTSVIVTGIDAEGSVPGIPAVPGGTSVSVGALAARRLGWTNGATVTVGSQKLRVDAVLPPSGTIDDLRVYGSLALMQQILNTGYRLSGILYALSTGAEREDFLAEAERQFSDMRVLLPEEALRARTAVRARVQGEVFRWGGIALAFLFLLSLLSLFSHVAARRSELAVLRAVGYTPGRVVRLLLLRTALLAVAGSVPGCVAGGLLAGRAVFYISTSAATSVLLSSAAGGAVAATAVFLGGLIPSFVAVRYSPARVIQGG